ncbi:MAG: hypothetical protein KatS3mg102_1972 [Planctomycetota bacterium]|nr:MAG: hypothetical protein KatS3mg102_1972 [Planctomycetota bacterium]
MDRLRWSTAASRAVELALAEARRRGHGRLESAHLLAGLLAVPGSPQALLAEQGLGASALAAHLDAAYEGPPLLAGAAVEQHGPEWREVVALAQEIADAEGSFEVEPRHLLLAATEDRRWSAWRVLEAAGVAPAALREAVQARRD